MSHFRFTLVSPPRFLHSSAYRGDRCASVLVMPARLRDAISGILAGGIPGFGTTTFLLGTSRSSCLVLALCCCFKDDLLRTGHTSCLVITSHCRHWTYHSNCDFLFFVFGFGVSCCLFWPCWCVFVLFGRLLVLFLSWNGIINTCTTNQVAFHSIGSTCNN